MSISLHFAIERQMPHATYFRFTGDGQFGGWEECRASDAGAVAMFTRHDVETIVEAVNGPPGVNYFKAWRSEVESHDWTSRFLTEMAEAVRLVVEDNPHGSNDDPLWQGMRAVLAKYDEATGD